MDISKNLKVDTNNKIKKLEKYIINTCSKCGQKGHYSAYCTNISTRALNYATESETDSDSEK
jgi:hypothetical protein